MDDCIFCEIIAGNAPASIIYQDDLVIVFLDINPVNPGHTLVVPRAHHAYLNDMDEATGMHLFKATMRMAKAIRKSGIDCEGINLFLADGEAAFQDVFHTHMHIIPRFKGDSFKISADWSSHPARSELDQIAERIRKGHTL